MAEGDNKSANVLVSDLLMFLLTSSSPAVETFPIVVKLSNVKSF